MRALITGMAGELGTRVAQVLESDRSVEQVVGTDFDPPRRRVRRVDFRRIDPRDERRLRDLVAEVDPTVIVHLGVYEPDARSTPAAASAMTAAAARAVFQPAGRRARLQRVVVRSGIEVYGRRRGSPLRPDETVAADPTSPFGRSLAAMEDLAVEAGRAADVPVARLRFAPLVGPHFPSPLGRYLRLPLVAVAIFADPPFSLLHQEDAAAAIVAATRRDIDGPLNVTGGGAVTARQAARMGGRAILPVAGPGWLLARRLADLAGAPVPAHVVELLVRGRTAATTGEAELGVTPSYDTPAVIKDLYQWASVTRLREAAA